MLKIDAFVVACICVVYLSDMAIKKAHPKDELMC